MKLRNPFSEETRMLYFYHYECCWCQQNGWDAIHHILGRVSSSPLNSAPIHNLKCHIGNSLLDTFENRSMLLKKTRNILLLTGYVFTTEDKQFIIKNKKYYDYNS